MTWTPQTWRDETEELKGKPLWKNHRVLSAILVVATLASLAPFI